MGDNSGGRYPTVVTDGTSGLGAGCLGSDALRGTGIAGITPLNNAVHDLHAFVIDPTNQMTLNSSDKRTAC